MVIEEENRGFSNQSCSHFRYFLYNLHRNNAFGLHIEIVLLRKKILSKSETMESASLGLHDSLFHR